MASAPVSALRALLLAALSPSAHRVAGDLDVEYIPVTGDPKLVLAALRALIERARDVPAGVSLDGMDDAKQQKLVQLAVSCGVDEGAIKTALLSAVGQHPCCLWRLFCRFTEHEISERGFWQIVTTHHKVLGANAKPTNYLAHYYENSSGAQTLEGRAYHLKLCRMLRVDNARDKAVILARLQEVNTPVRVCLSCPRSVCCLHITVCLNEAAECMLAGCIARHAHY